MIGFILAELGSLGYRIIRDEHIPSDYVVEKVKLNLSSLGISFDREVTIKVIRRKDKTILTANVEYEDLQSIAEELEKQHVNLPMMKLKSMIESNFLKKSFDKANKKLKSQSRRL